MSRSSHPADPRVLGAVILLAAAIAGLAPLPAAAQDDPSAVRLPAAVRSSPFDPPAEDVFVADDGPGLDTGCTFNTDPNHPLVIDVLIDQAVGPVDGNGFLVDPGALIAAGVIPATVEVTLPAFDVDVNGSPPPESDQVLLNGQSLGFLSGDNAIWKLNGFTVGVDKIKFPPPSGGTAANRVQINVDTLSSGRWCTAIDWVALVLPIELPTAVKLEPTGANPIRERSYASSATIDTIYEQSFDASCALTTDIGPYDDYPFSGSATPGTARLHATLSTCPASSTPPEVKADWSIAGTSLSGTSTWTGLTGDVDLTMPSAVGAYDVELTFTVDDDAKPAIHRKLFVTKAAPLGAVSPPRLGWYEKATDWASGQSAEDGILTSLLSGLYSYGGGHWRYGYVFTPGVLKCTWQDLVEDPISCDYADCYVFSEVLQGMAATLGVGGLTAVVPVGAHNPLEFLTNGSPSLDPAFRGNARPVGAAAFDRYVFTSHSLRLKAGKYYDSTFNGIYSSPTAFITANRNSTVAADGDGPYYGTDEGWKLYPRPGTPYDSWNNWAYKSPPGPIFEGPTAPPATSPTSAAAPDLTGSASFDPVDEDVDGLFEALTAEVEVVLDVNGEHTVFGTLQKAGQVVANRPAWESMLPTSETIDEIAGTRTVTLRFSGEQIFSSGLDGPYDLVVFVIGPSGFDTATIATPAFDHTEFGELPARLIGVTEAAVDTTGDGTFEYLEATVDLDVRVDSQLRLEGALSKDGQSIDSTGVSQLLTAAPHQVVLRFDGGKILRSGLDGPYEGSVNLIDATGHTIDGVQFTTGPYDGGSFSALLNPMGPFSDQGLDTNGNGLYDLLRVDFGADVAQAGSYLLTGVLRSAASSSAVFTDSSVTLPAGAASLRLDFPGPEIESLGLDGPYTVDVLVRDPATLEELDSVRLPQVTAAYLASQFDGFGDSNLPIVLTGNSTDTGIDTDGNGLYDLLRVDLEVALARSDVYEWSARLVDRGGTEIGFYTRRATLPAGIVDIEFVFDGETIGMNGVDGPYFVRSLLIFGRSGANLVKVDVAETAAYPYTAFEGAGDLEPPVITVAAGPTLLSPPNHQAVSVAVADLVVAVTDNLDTGLTAADVVISRVSSDEPEDAEGNGDGATTGDVVIASDCRSVDLRAERAGSGNGRVYTIELAVADAHGNVGTASYRVEVPHDASDGGAVDDGAAYTVEGCSP